jgi:hypothetical protein
MRALVLVCVLVMLGCASLEAPRAANCADTDRLHFLADDGSEYSRRLDWAPLNPELKAELTSLIPEEDRGDLKCWYISKDKSHVGVTPNYCEPGAVISFVKRGENWFLSNSLVQHVLH